MATSTWAFTPAMPGLTHRTLLKREGSKKHATWTTTQPSLVVPSRAMDQTVGDGRVRVASSSSILFQMTRPRTLPLSAILLTTGAWGAERNFAFLSNPPVMTQLVLMGALVMLTTATSMLVNEYWDHKLDVDSHDSAPSDHPLVEGLVSPEQVKGLCKWLYAAHLGLLLLIQQSSLRMCIYLNTMATFLYTRYFKPIPGVKNLLCAGVIATTVALGAAVVKGSLMTGAAAVWPAVVVVGGGIMHREIVMDVVDVHGDRKAGLRTLPVVFGQRRALLLSCAPLLAAVAVTATATAKPILSSAPLVVMCGLALRAVQTVGTNDETKRMDSAIELAPLLLFTSMVFGLS